MISPVETSLFLDRVSVQFGSVTALRDVHLEVAQGERLGMVGMSGAGKTTLLRLFNGMVRPAQGSVHTLGQRLDSLSFGELRALRARVGLIHQDLSLIPNLSVLQNVLAGRLGHISTLQAIRLFTLPPKQTVAEVYAILERVGIGDKLYERADRLSGGERQRVAIARALFQKPEILLADEPVSSVDPARAAAVLELLTDLARQDRLTLCVSIHNLPLARQYFPRLVGLRAGKSLFDKPTASILDAEFQALFEI